MPILDGDDDLLGDIIIEKHKDYFEIIFTKSYRCRISDYQKTYCVVEQIDKNKVFDLYSFLYKNFDVKDIEELFLLLIKEPREIIRILTKNDIPISRLIIEYNED
jgi:hypothetical protein